MQTFIFKLNNRGIDKLTPLCYTVNTSSTTNQKYTKQNN